MTEFAYLVPIASLVLTLLLAIGGVFAFRGAINRSASEIQKSTIETLESMNAAQERQIKILEKKIARLENAITTLQYTLKKRRGLLLEINDEVITLVDQITGQENIVKIRVDSGEIEVIKKED